MQCPGSPSSWLDCTFDVLLGVVMQDMKQHGKCSSVSRDSFLSAG